MDDFDAYTTHKYKPYKAPQVPAQPEQEPVAVDCCANCLRPKHEHMGGYCPNPYTTVWHAWDYPFTPDATPPQRKPQNGIATEDGIAWQAGAFGTTRTAVTVDGRSWYRDDNPKVAQRKPLTDEQREEIAKGWRGRNWTVGDIIDAVEAAHGIKE